jgi:ribosomal protein S4
MYGVLENQFRNTFKEADRQKGITGEVLLSLLERRLDNAVYRLGFANSRNEARQLVRHNHFLVNQTRVNIPSYLVKPGDVIELREKSKKVVRILEALEGVARRGVPQWLELDKEQLKGSVKGLPARREALDTLRASPCVAAAGMAPDLDTMLAEFILEPGSRLGLKHLARIRLGVEMTEIAELLGRGKAAFDYFKKLLRTGSIPTFYGRAYVYPQYITSDEHETAGRASHSWIGCMRLIQRATS